MGRMKDQAHARHTDPHTSHAAAAGVTKTLTEKQNAVLDLFKARIKLTDADIIDYFGGKESTYRKRRTELVALGLVRDSGEVRKQDRTSRIVWEIVD